MNGLVNFIGTNYFVAFAVNAFGIVDGKDYDDVSFGAVGGKVHGVVSHPILQILPISFECRKGNEIFAATLLSFVLTLAFQCLLKDFA